MPKRSRLESGFFCPDFKWSGIQMPRNGIRYNPNTARGSVFRGLLYDFGFLVTLTSKCLEVPEPICRDVRSIFKFQHTPYFWTALCCPSNQVLLPSIHAPKPAPWSTNNFALQFLTSLWNSIQISKIFTYFKIFRKGWLEGFIGYTYDTEIPITVDES
jgi:hypothetical protein